MFEPNMLQAIAYACVGPLFVAGVIFSFYIVDVVQKRRVDAQLKKAYANIEKLRG